MGKSFVRNGFWDFSRKDLVMSRLYTLGTWFCTSVAMALALLVPLAVPEGALADSGQTCYANCQTSCYNQCGNDSACIQQCMGQCTGPCCASACNGDSTCQSTCCQEACGGDSTCLQNCLAAASQCAVKYDTNKNPQGCENPGQACTTGYKKGTCGAPPGGNPNSCNCNAAGGP